MTSNQPPPMGNSVSHWQSGGAAAATGKVILSDGAVFKYDEPVTAAELMLEHPQEVVVELINGKKPTPLAADEILDRKKLYVMLPIKKGKQTTLSYQEAKELLTKTNSLLKSKALLSYTGFLPMFVRICHPVREHGAPISIMHTKEDRNYFSTVSELEERPEFLSRQISGKGWKPSLDTIKEKTTKAKSIHWLF